MRTLKKLDFRTDFELRNEKKSYLSRIFPVKMYRNYLIRAYVDHSSTNGLLVHHSCKKIKYFETGHFDRSN